VTASVSISGRHILVVGINYWPEPTGIAPYTAAVAEHLAGRAASVEVLSGLPCYPTWQVPAAYRRRRRFVEERRGVTVHRLKHLVPAKQDALRRGAYEFSFLGHAATRRPTMPPDLVLGITPALGGAVAAALLARRYDARLMLVVQDLLGQAATQSGISGGDRVAKQVERLERFALSRADAVAVVSDAFRAQLTAYGVPAERVHTVPNWSHVAPATGDRDATRASLGWAPDTFVALHTGNMGLKQDLGNIIEAARLSQDRPDLRWVLMGEGSQRAHLEEQGRGLPNLQFLPLCDDETYRNILAAADVLLLNERAGLTEMSLPSKLTSYFTSGRPVVAAVHPDGASARELKRAGALDPVEPNCPAALVARVEELRASPALCAEHGALAATYAREELTEAAAMRRYEAVIAAAFGEQLPEAASVRLPAARRGGGVPDAHRLR
jgi:glycosyltransferase involved in cell wall biosynthesis